MFIGQSYFSMCSNYLEYFLYYLLLNYYFCLKTEGLQKYTSLSSFRHSMFFFLVTLHFLNPRVVIILEITLLTFGFNATYKCYKLVPPVF